MKYLVAPLQALTDDRLSNSERKVLLALYSFKGKSDTVFPSLSAISERATIRDISQISRHTTSLAKLGWLTKKKRGFTGYNDYKLTLPINLAETPNLAETTNLSETPNLVENTKSNLVETTKCKEHTSQQTSQQSGVSPDQKFEMYDLWQPDSFFADQSRLAGLEIEKIPPERINQIVAEFKSYWMARSNSWGRSSLTHREWQHKLLTNVIRESRKGDLYDAQKIRKIGIEEKLTDRGWAR